MKKIIAIIGARPQFIKHYPFEQACKDRLDLITIHTGQHFDENMSKVFFDQLSMSKPDYLLQLGGGNHGIQTGKMMEAIEEIVLKEKPDWMVVYGDTNSTLAGALVAAKLHIPIAHIEAGLRSYNRSMPEEINRVLTDHVSTLLFTPSEVANVNLSKEGITKGIHTIGDIMKDLLSQVIDKKLFATPEVNEPFYYVTLHRPYNVDEKERLNYVLTTLNQLDKKVIFAIHPRTRVAMKKFDMPENQYSNILFIDPQPYFENIGYLNACDAAITDSGGMQKEVYWLGKKCITVRSETEWVETLEGNANTLIFEDLSLMQAYLSDTNITFDQNLYGQGQSCKSIVDTLLK